MAEARAEVAGLEEALEASTRYRSLWGDATRRFSRHRTAMLGLVLVVILGSMAAAAPLIQRHDSSFQNYDSLKQSPSSEYWLGTDLLGRDQWSRLVNGARISLSVGFLTQAVAVAIGMTI
ncbi:MAG TPA: hypothetical protein VFT91_09970, partial [Dehalococcoidia bacterium]|nr:hypothetical protein [Dehalococcoidia bacterium]